ncbi:hypothetical protein JCM11491_001988 [Sporobolomyces phaffii]
MIETHRASLSLPSGSTLVEDADEEIFLLYTRAAGSDATPKGGLGFHSAARDVLDLDLSIEPPPPDSVDSNSNSNQRRGRGRGRGRARANANAVEVHVELHQSVSNLRHRAGDTGSVVWRLSLAVARFVLEAHHFARRANNAVLLPHLATSTVLELGSGTGFLGIALRGVAKHWTFSDQFDHLALIQRNLRANSIPDPDPAYAIVELDWLVERATTTSAAPDVIFAVDCVYNPELAVALAHTLVANAARETVSVVACELRAPDAVELFLATWLDKGRARFGPGRWRVARLGWDDRGGGSGLSDPNFVVWVGWCTE